MEQFLIISNVPLRPIWLIPTQATDPTSNSQDLKDGKAALLGLPFQDEQAKKPPPLSTCYMNSYLENGIIWKNCSRDVNMVPSSREFLFLLNC